ncbi:hypothetical protein C0Q70_07205 [Pomacea canaliculata]|uniref:Cadherin domain-containing protein n=1 Tax=Pomacea canaliculata TaxID=400727 RepID=A0A2T7PEF2_POMCA|nr:hypothetical protein C0Q70_07205 [Pomacea canaliculata]
MDQTTVVIITVSAILMLTVHVDAGPTVSLQTGNAVLPVDTKPRTLITEVYCSPSSSSTTTTTPSPYSCTCNINPPTIPVNAPFDCWRLTTNENYKVYFIGTQAGSTKLSSDVTPTIDAKNTASGTTVYTLTVTDNEQDALSYSMTQKPDSGYFTIGPSDGIIRTAVDMKTVPEDTVICTVSVSDGINTVKNFIVTIKLSSEPKHSSFHHQPTRNGQLTETQRRYTLTTLTFTDPDTTQTLVPECSVEPADESYKFTYETNTRRLKLVSLTSGQKLLTTQTTNRVHHHLLGVRCYLYSTVDVLTVFVSQHQRGRCRTPATYLLHHASQQSGVSSCHLGLTVTDPEQNAITSVALQSGGNNDLFRYISNHHPHLQHRLRRRQHQQPPRSAC